MIQRTALAMRLWVGVAAAATGLGALAPLAHAVLPDEVLADPALEARARNLSKDLRCLVCQNQSIDDSGAALARDLRVLVRERLTAGDSDGQVIDYLVARYGNFVLLKPPLQSDTMLLWLGPGIIVTIAGAAFVAYTRRRAGIADAPPPALTDGERQQLAELAGEPTP